MYTIDKKTVDTFYISIILYAMSVRVTQQQNKYFPYDRICPIPHYNNGLTSRWSQQPRLPRCSYQLTLVECPSVPPIRGNGH